jgi:hypothetical protein
VYVWCANTYTYTHTHTHARMCILLTWCRKKSARSGQQLSTPLSNREVTLFVYLRSVWLLRPLGRQIGCPMSRARRSFSFLVSAWCRVCVLCSVVCRCCVSVSVYVCSAVVVNNGELETRAMYTNTHAHAHSHTHAHTQTHLRRAPFSVVTFSSCSLRQRPSFLLMRARESLRVRERVCMCTREREIVFVSVRVCV